MRRAAPPLAAVLCLAAAAALILLAVDARAWHSTLTRDDLRFRALHTHSGLWNSPAMLPGDPARAVLGVGGDVAYRRALQLFWLSRVGTAPRVRADLSTIRVRAQSSLVGLVDSAATAAERSTAANLLGVLTVTTKTTDRKSQSQTLQRAAEYFQRAILEDPSDYAAKLNLELVQRLRKPGKSKLGQSMRSGFGFSKGRAAVVGGSGY